MQARAGASPSEAFSSACASGGCGAKIESDALSALLSGLPRMMDERLLVGYETSDDAAVYALDDKNSLVFTADFFPPMIDDPFAFGKIAAANALSDVWAMGARPALALNLVCFPESMDKGALADMLRGGAEKIAEAGAALGGGHTIYSCEPKYGLAVVGFAETARVLRNDAPRPGDALILTKPLGTGIVLAAWRADMAGAGALGAATASMERLNRYAFECMSERDASACTDVTGFGLLAHALEMASTKATLVIRPEALPRLPEAEGYAREYLLTAAGQRNRNRVGESVDVGALPFAVQELLFDPQTSGGLLIAVAADEAEDLLARIRAAGDASAAIIGEVSRRLESPVIFR